MVIIDDYNKLKKLKDSVIGKLFFDNERISDLMIELYSENSECFMVDAYRINGTLLLNTVLLLEIIKENGKNIIIKNDRIVSNSTGYNEQTYDRLKIMHDKRYIIDILNDVFEEQVSLIHKLFFDKLNNTEA